MLFLTYINDITEGVTSQMRMLPDDSIVYRQIHTPADHFTLPLTISHSRWPFHTPADHFTLPLTISHSRWPFHTPADHFTLPLTISHSRWSFHTPADHFTLPLTISHSRWPFHTPADHFTLPLTISHSRWPFHTPADHFTLASDRNKLLYLAKTWQMDFNVSKRAVLSVTTKRNISAYDYFVESQQIPRTDREDYLGLTINTKLSWQPHINKVQNKTNSTLGLLKRTLHCTPYLAYQQTFYVRCIPLERT